MKKFYLLELQYNANKVLIECFSKTKANAVKTFQSLRPDLHLDDDGYSREGNDSADVYDGHKTYCVAEGTA